MIPPMVPADSVDDDALAKYIVTLGGFKLAYTLALALQTLAEALTANEEPEKLLTKAEALALANALLRQVPESWLGEDDGTAPPSPLVSPDVARAVAARIGEAAQTQAIPWVDPTTRKDVL